MSAITSAKSNLGFVGIGYMGRPIAQRFNSKPASVIRSQPLVGCVAA